MKRSCLAALLLLCACRPVSEVELTRPAQKREIEAYALKTTVASGEPLPIAVSVASASAVSWRAFRIGRHRAGGHQIAASGGPVAATRQADCAREKATGLVSCGWKQTFALPTRELLPGLYVVHLTDAQGMQTLVPFVVRDRRARPEVVVIVPVATWAAYNHWGGQSLYNDADDDTGAGHSFAVSLDKPFATGNGAGDLMRYDRHLAEWLDHQDLTVGWITSDELDRDPEALASARAIFVSGHDEYWTGNQRTRIEAAVARGASLLLLGANAGYWQVRWQDAADGRDRRTLVCYKERARDLDPVGPTSPELTGRFRDAPVSRPESALFGVAYNDGWNYYAFPLIVEDPSHWALQGTGLRKGDVIARGHGYEVDAVDGATPPGTEVVARSPTLSYFGKLRPAHMVVRQQGEALVFAAGGTDFVRALASSDAFDARAARVVANVLYRALKRPVPHNLPDFSTHDRAQPMGPYARLVETVAGSKGELGAPLVLAAMRDGSLVASDAASDALRRIAADGSVTTLPQHLPDVMGLAADDAGNLYASSFADGTVHKLSAGGSDTVIAGKGESAGDGPGAKVHLRGPAGLAVQGGALYIAEAGAGSVRRVDLTDPAFPVRTLAKGLASPTAVAVRADGSFFVTELIARRIVSFPAGGGEGSVVAGDGEEGLRDGEPLHARLPVQFGLAVLPDGALAMSDAQGYRVRVLERGVVHTLAGTGRSGHRSGRGDEADLAMPAGLALGQDGRLYVAAPGAGLVRAITR